MQDKLEHQDAFAEAAPARAGLAAAIIHVARSFGLSCDETYLTDGLPLNGPGEVGAPYFVEAARRAGLTSRIERRPLSQIPTLALPTVLFLRSGDAVVLTERRGRRAVVVDPTAPDSPPKTLRLRRLEQDYSGVCALLAPARDAEAEAAHAPEAAPKTWRGGSWFWSAARRFWPNYLQVVLAAFLVNVLALASPIFVMNVYDRVVPNLAIPTLWALTAGVALAVLLDLLLRILRGAIVDETGRRVDMAVSGRIFDHLLALRLADRGGSTGLTANQLREFDAVRDVLTSSSVIAVTDAAFIGIFIAVMAWLVGPLALVPALAAPAVLIAAMMCQAPLGRAARQGQADGAERHGVLVETIGALETVKAVGAASALRARWDRSVAATSRAQARVRFWSNLAVTIVASAQQAVSIIIIVYGVHLIIDGAITVGALIAATLLSGRALAPLANIAQTLARVAQARAAFQTLSRFMSAPTERAAAGRKAGDETALEPKSGAVAIDGASFEYPGAAAPALIEVSFEAEAGARIGVLGRVGSGKSTLGRLIAGLYEPNAGAVLLGGVDLRQHAPAAARQAVGYLGQEPELFSGALRENIVIGAPGAGPKALRRACALSGVDAFAAAHPKGLDMPIIERGRNLSGGQRQAVALARLLIRRPKVLFLDEPTAAMDTATERLLIERLRAVAETGVTLFIATHRDAPLALADRLLVFDRGRLALDGPKDKVLTALRKGVKARIPGESDAKADAEWESAARRETTAPEAKPNAPAAQEAGS